MDPVHRTRSVRNLAMDGALGFRPGHSVSQGQLAAADRRGVARGECLVRGIWFLPRGVAGKPNAGLCAGTNDAATARPVSQGSGRSFPARALRAKRTLVSSLATDPERGRRKSDAKT